MISNGRAYWWVNHKQTFKAEIEGGYVWSPKRKKDGSFNMTYENLSHVKPGDVVVSYANTVIKAIGIATTGALDRGKPKEFGQGVGENWSEHDGWLVPIEWTLLPVPIRPKDHISQIAPLLPSKYSPIRLDGNGNESCYLASISSDLGHLILTLAGQPDTEAISRIEELADQIEDDVAEQEILKSHRQPTEKDQLVRARQGQGVFRQRVMSVEGRCRVTGVADERFLIASHIKPWRVSDDQERLDGENGFLLAPHIDKLFDKGWVSFTEEGQLLVAVEALKVLNAWNIGPDIDVGRFTQKQSQFLSHHRQYVFKLKLNS
ncbi:HNH endonuclease [Pseudomonas sp. ANT_H12B]|uniref:HNH endonuclease n=1 Tax=Pseudomonas sp. ANT_H12B TaxID=2597348 RepID=UPI0011EDF5DF|nr:HNH endonuclease [Pseudomonas sp. ANT_H12B]KAA0975701.1 HNH endonuclease [Pseudomonas sp. ANT_H12B]